jgi:hypothetical protein
VGASGGEAGDSAGATTLKAGGSGGGVVSDTMPGPSAWPSDAESCRRGVAESVVLVGGRDASGVVTISDSTPEGGPGGGRAISNP